MQAIRIIPCLDVTAGRVVKGVNFVQLRDAGDPVEIAARYDEQGADELTFLDITASTEGRGQILPVIRQITASLSIPLTVGGGVASLADARRLLDAGASRVGINSAATREPQLVAEVAEHYGRDSVVVAIDGLARRGDALAARGAGWDVVTQGGRHNTGRDAVEWAREAERLGAGQILLTSMDRDGTGDGFDLELTHAVSSAVGIPVIASGGAGSLQDLADGVLRGGAAAVLAASIFHYGRFTIAQAKRFLAERGIAVHGAGAPGAAA